MCNASYLVHSRCNASSELLEGSRGEVSCVSPGSQVPALNNIHVPVSHMYVCTHRLTHRHTHVHTHTHAHTHTHTHRHTHTHTRAHTHTHTHTARAKGNKKNMLLPSTMTSFTMEENTFTLTMTLNNHNSGMPLYTHTRTQ